MVEDKSLEHLLLLMEMEIRNGCPSGRIYAESLSIAFITYLTQTHAIEKPLRKVTDKFASQRIQKVKTYIRENLLGDLSIVELAMLVHLSPYHFSRVFKAAVGMTPHRYVMEQRIIKAQELLKSGFSVTEAAHMTGFSSQAHLSNQFRKRFGFAPTDNAVVY